MKFGTFLVVSGLGLFVVTGYQTMLHRESMRAATAVTHQDSQGMDRLPMYIMWQLIVATCLSLLGGVTAYGAVKPIMISEAPPVTGEHPEFRDFLSFNNRGRILGALTK